MTDIEILQNKADEKWGPNHVSILAGTSMDKPFTIKCLHCGNIKNYTTARMGLHPQTYCLKCNNPRMKTLEKFQEEMKVIDSSITVIGPYLGDGKNIKVKHSCGCEWEATPSNLLRGKGCPDQACINNKREQRVLAKTNGVYHHTSEIPAVIEKTQASHGAQPRPESYYERTKNRETFIAWLETIPFSERTYNHCAKLLGCSPTGVRISLVNRFKCKEYFNKVKSTKEIVISKFLKENNIEFEEQKSFEDLIYKRSLKFDFFLPAYNLLIEYDGEDHFFPIDRSNKGKEWAKEQFEYLKIRDNLKNEYVKNNSELSLLRIPYYDFDKMEELIMEKINGKK
jgi:hypothetical protein